MAKSKSKEGARATVAVAVAEKLLAPGSINVRLAAVRRLTYEAADTGLLSADLAAGIRRVTRATYLPLSERLD